MGQIQSTNGDTVCHNDTVYTAAFGGSTGENPTSNPSYWTEQTLWVLALDAADATQKYSQWSYVEEEQYTFMEM